MGEQTRGGAGDVGVGVEERLERLHEVGLVLLVVGHQRLDRLGVEAVQLGRVLAHGGQQEPVGASVLEGQHRVLGPRLGDVGGQQRLVARAVEVDGIGGQPRVPDREGEAVQARAQLAHDRVGDAAHLRLGGGRQQHDDVAAVDHGGQRAGSAGARGALGGGQHAAAPVLVGGRVVVRADHDQRGAGGDVDAQLGRAGDDVAAVGHLAPQHGAQEPGLRGLGRPLGRAHALDLGRDQRRDHAQQRGPRLARAPAHPQPPDHGVPHPQLVRDDAGGVGHQRPLVGARARGHRQHGARAVDQHERGVERPRRGADHLGQAEPGLDGVADLGQRVEVVRRGRLAPDRDRLGHRSYNRS